MYNPFSIVFSESPSSKSEHRSKRVQKGAGEEKEVIQSCPWADLLASRATRRVNGSKRLAVVVIAGSWVGMMLPPLISYFS